jgi:hypothetical protein
VQLDATIGDPVVKERHSKQMTKQSVMVPVDFVVTFSIETHHPSGTARHMSMSVPERDRRPSPEAVWMVAQELGFEGGETWQEGFRTCHLYEEQLVQGASINVVQLIAVQAGGTA